MTPIRGWWAGAAGAARKSRPPTPLDRRLLGLGWATRAKRRESTPQPAIPNPRSLTRAHVARAYACFLYIYLFPFSEFLSIDFEQ